MVDYVFHVRTEALRIFLRDISNAEVITQRAEKKPHSHPPSITSFRGPDCTYENHTFSHARLFEFSKMKH